jgi:hypothetical protein
LKAKRHSGRTAASDIETEGIMTTKPRIAIVIGSTRPGRYADKAAGWMLKQAQTRDDLEAELLDLCRFESKTTPRMPSAASRSTIRTRRPAALPPTGREVERRQACLSAGQVAPVATGTRQGFTNR